MAFLLFDRRGGFLMQVSLNDKPKTVGRSRGDQRREVDRTTESMAMATPSDRPRPGPRPRRRMSRPRGRAMQRA
jgi:hypothetical protein